MDKNIVNVIIYKNVSNRSNHFQIFIYAFENQVIPKGTVTQKSFIPFSDQIWKFYLFFIYEKKCQNIKFSLNFAVCWTLRTRSTCFCWTLRTKSICYCWTLKSYKNTCYQFLESNKNICYQFLESIKNICQQFLESQKQHILAKFDNFLQFFS